MYRYTAGPILLPLSSPRMFHHWRILTCAANRWLVEVDSTNEADPANAAGPGWSKLELDPDPNLR